MLDDIAYAVLRQEFGYGGKATPTWRPAVKEMQSSLRLLGRKYIEYMMDGNEARFELGPVGEVSKGEVSKLEGDFQSRIVKATGIK